MNIRKYTVAILLFILVSIAVPGIFPAQAQIIPFGGRALFTTWCSCTPECFLVQVGPPKGGSFMYCFPPTILYSYYTITPPAWQLGIASGFRMCMMASFWGCYSIGGGPVVLKVGTSVY